MAIASGDHSRLSLGQARRLQLAAMGLLQPRSGKASRASLIEAMEQMRLLQIDTIHVVARSPYLVLHARLGEYPLAWLTEALADGQLAECWAHEACFVSATHIAWHRASIGLRAHHWAHRHAERLYREQSPQMDKLLETVREFGAVRAADFAHRREPGTAGWWDWKPQKQWLEAWFALGELMVVRRENFQRVYDLSERVLARLQPPLDSAAARLSPAQARRQGVIDSIRALGVTQAAWVADYFRLRPRVTDIELAPLVANGELLTVTVEGWARPGYVHRDHAPLLEKAQAGRLRATHTALLSPFDPLVWDRARVKAMFDFDYTLECYMPAARRRYGYFVLPILYRGQLVGRIDAKAHRTAGLFEVKALFLEPGVRIDERLVRSLAQTIHATAQWHATPEVRIVKTQPRSLLNGLRRSLQLLT